MRYPNVLAVSEGAAVVTRRAGAARSTNPNASTARLQRGHRAIEVALAAAAHARAVALRSACDLHVRLVFHAVLGSNARRRERLGGHDDAANASCCIAAVLWVIAFEVSAHGQAPIRGLLVAGCGGRGAEAGLVPESQTADCIAGQSETAADGDARNCLAIARRPRVRIRSRADYRARTGRQNSERAGQEARLHPHVNSGSEAFRGGQPRSWASVCDDAPLLDLEVPARSRSSTEGDHLVERHDHRRRGARTCWRIRTRSRGAAASWPSRAPSRVCERSSS